jgi:hypothetical protein
MSLKHVAVAFALLFLLAFTWRLAPSDWARSPGPAAGKPATPIQFDNGTVRQYDSAASVAARNKGQPLPLGTLRKCQRGSETSYTNSFCPPGTRELKLDKGTVNVVETHPATSAATLSQGQPQPTLRELAVERAVHR